MQVVINIILIIAIEIAVTGLVSNFLHWAEETPIPKKKKNGHKIDKWKLK